MVGKTKSKKGIFWLSDNHKRMEREKKVTIGAEDWSDDSIR